MTLVDLANIAQLVSAGAVIVSLVYLAIQIRQNTIQIRANSRVARLALQEDFVATQQESMMRLAENPELYRIWRLGSTAPERMSDEERERFGMLLFSQMYRYAMMVQAREIDPLAQDRALLQLGLMLRLPAFRSWWERQRYLFAFDAAFVAIIDERIARDPVAGADGEGGAASSTDTSRVDRWRAPSRWPKLRRCPN